MTKKEIALMTGAFEALCDKVAEGMTLTAACALAGVDYPVVAAHRRADPAFAAQLEAALEIGSEAIADMLSEIHTLIREPILARIVSENRRWLLARRFAKKYGDRLAIDDGRGADLTGALREAIARIPLPGRTLSPAEHLAARMSLLGDVTPVPPPDAPAIADGRGADGSEPRHRPKRRRRKH